MAGNADAGRIDLSREPSLNGHTLDLVHHERNIAIARRRAGGVRRDGPQALAHLCPVGGTFQQAAVAARMLQENPDIPRLCKGLAQIGRGIARSAQTG